VIDDGVLAKLTPERMASVAAPKIAGAFHLHRATEGDGLDAFVLFSSLSGTIGALGQANYAAANAFLDALARHRRAAGKAALAIAWGPWAEVGMAARGNASAMEAVGFTPMPPGDGLRVLGALLAGSPPPRVAVAHADFRRWAEAGEGATTDPFFADVRGGARARPKPLDPEIAQLAEQLSLAPPARRQGLARRLIGRAAAKLLKVPEASVPTSAPLMTLGLDSLLGLQLRGVLEQALSIRVPAVELYNRPTVEMLADYLLARLEPPKAPEEPAVPASDADASAALLDPELAAALVGGVEDPALADQLRELLETADKLPELP
jgi:acyl carrier protein